MKKAGIAFVIGAALSLASPALADQIQVGDPTGSYPLASHQGYGPYQTGNGGEFTLTLYDKAWLDLSSYSSLTTNQGNPDLFGSFQTFCIEGSEYIYPYAAVYDATLGPNAMYGGNPPNGDPVSQGTGWLYSQFASGTWLNGLSYNYSATAARTTSADLLQRAIWWLEGEESIAYNSSNAYMLGVVTQFGSAANAMADGAAIYGVSAVHLGAAGAGQDQLYYHSVPDGGATFVLLGVALGGMGLFARRTRRS